MSSLRSRAVVGSGPPLRLTLGRRSLPVRPFFNRGLLLVVDFAGALTALAAMVVFSFLPILATVAQVLCGAAVGERLVGSRGSSPFRGCDREWERYRGGSVRPGSSVLEGANFLAKGFDLFAVRIDGRPVVLVNLIDHLDQDHILFAGGGSPNLLVLVYLVEKVQEVGAWTGVSQVSLMNM